MAPPARRLVDRLLDDTGGVTDHLIEVVVSSAPVEHRDVLRRECDPIMRRLIPATLAALGEDEDAGVAAAAAMGEASILASAGRMARAGVPASVVLLSVVAATAAFSRLVGEIALHDGPQAAAYVVGRAVRVTHGYSSAFVRGYRAAAGSAGTVTDPLDLRILRMVAYGRSTRQIAEQLHYSEQTITLRLSSLFRRFGAANRTELVARAYEQGALSIPDS